MSTVFTVEEAAEQLGFSSATVRQMCRDGELRASKRSKGPKGHYRITQAAIDEWFEKTSRTTKSSA